MTFGIGKKMVICFSVYLTIIFVAIIWAVLVYTKQMTVDNIITQQFATTELIAQSLDHKLGSYMVAIVAHTDELPVTAFEHPDQAQDFLDKNHDLMLMFDNGLFLVDTSYRLVAEHPYIAGRRGVTIPALTQFLDGLKDDVMPGISSPYISPKTGQPAFVVAAQVYDKSGRLRGFLMGGISLSNDHFVEELLDYKIGTSGYLYIFNTQRTMIMHPDKKRVMKNDIPPGANPLLDSAIEGFEGSGETVNSRGVHQIASFKHLKTTDWIVASAFPIAEANKPIVYLRNYLAAAGILVTLVSIIMIRLLVRRVTRNLESFTRQVAGISSHPGEIIEIQIESRDEVSQLADSFNGLMRELSLSRKSLDDMTRIDFLTGLFNRRHLELEAPKLFALSKRNKFPVAIFMVDIDFFKRVNDVHGHEAGDAVLVDLARILQLSVRPYDLVVRQGGEEFLILMTLTCHQDAGVVAERIRSTVQDTPVRYRDETISITVSIGVYVSGQMSDLHSAISIADTKLYEAKESGRNRVCMEFDRDGMDD